VVRTLSRVATSIRLAAVRRIARSLELRVGRRSTPGEEPGALAAHAGIFSVHVCKFSCVTAVGLAGVELGMSFACIELRSGTMPASTPASDMRCGCTDHVRSGKNPWVEILSLLHLGLAWAEARQTEAGGRGLRPRVESLTEMTQEFAL
jgi:hypothetical protein